MPDELLTPGKGKFIIKHVKLVDEYGQHLQTKKGDRKALIIVEATDSKGAKAAVFEHLTMNAAWKVELICKACRHHELFVSSAVCLDKLDELEGAVGECIIGHSEANSEWPVKTIITKYIAPKGGEYIVEKPVAVAAVETPFFDDEIPF